MNGNMIGDHVMPQVVLLQKLSITLCSPSPWDVKFVIEHVVEWPETPSQEHAPGRRVGRIGLMSVSFVGLVWSTTANQTQAASVMGRRSSGRLQLRFPIYGNPTWGRLGLEFVPSRLGSFTQLAAAVADLPNHGAGNAHGSGCCEEGDGPPPSRRPAAAGTLCVARYGGLRGSAGGWRAQLTG